MKLMIMMHSDSRRELLLLLYYLANLEDLKALLPSLIYSLSLVHSMIRKSEED